MEEGRIYKIELEGIGTLIMPEENLGTVRDLFFDSAVYASNMIDYCYKTDCRSTAALFEQTYCQRMSWYEQFGEGVEEHE